MDMMAGSDILSSSLPMGILRIFADCKVSFFSCMISPDKRIKV